MSTDNKNTETARLTPRLILNPSSNKPITTTSSMFFPSSPIAAGVFYLPIIQKKIIEIIEREVVIHQNIYANLHHLTPIYLQQQPPIVDI